MLIINQMWTSAKLQKNAVQVKLTAWTRKDLISAYVKTDTLDTEDFVRVSEVLHICANTVDLSF